jgi:hypothetical protein
MLSLAPELEALRPRLGDPTVNHLLAKDRRQIFSVYPELRIAGWLGATMLAAAAGLLLKNNLDRIGPLALSIAIGLAALACYAWTWLRRERASVIDDYILLLGALLVSADVAFIESQYHLLGETWNRYLLLLLAIVHGAGAYVYNSRILVSLSASSLAGFFGFDKRIRFEAVPAFELAGILLAWRALDGALRPSTTFSRTLEHFAANAALIGGLSLMDDHLHAGTLLTIAVAAAVIVWGFRVRHEPFVLYGFVYGLIAADWFFLETLSVAEAFVLLVSMIVGVAGLLFLHAWFKERK